MVKIEETFLQHLKELVGISSSMIQEKDLGRLLNMIAEITRDYCGFNRVVVSLLDEDFLVYNMGTAGLSKEEENTLHKKSLTPEERRLIFREKYKIGESFYIPAGEIPWGDRGVTSDSQPLMKNGWNPDDYLFVPIVGQEGQILGLVSTDEPSDSKLPDRNSLIPIEMLANIAASAVQNASLWQNYKTQLEQIQEINLELKSLQKTTADLLISLDLEEVLSRIAENVVSGLGFTAAIVMDYAAGERVLTVKAVAGEKKLISLVEEIIESPMIGQSMEIDPDSADSGIKALFDSQIICTDNLGDVLFPVMNEDLAKTIQKLFGINSMASVPLVSDRVLRGILFAASIKTELVKTDTESLQAFANQAGIAIQNASLYHNLYTKTSELASLNDINTRLSQHPEFDTTLKESLCAAIDNLDAVTGLIHLKEGDELVFKTSRKLKKKYQKWYSSKKVAGILKDLLSEEIPILERKGSKTGPGMLPLDDPPPYGSAQLIPLRSKGNLVGSLLLLFDDEPSRIGTSTDFLLALGSQIGIAIENASLYSDLKEAVSHLEEAQEHLIQTEKLSALGQLAGGIAHDFNNILSAILGRAQLLQQQTDDQVVIDGLELIEKAAFDGGETVRRIQEFTRVRTEKRFNPINLNEIVNDSVQIVKPRWKDQAERKGIIYNFDLDLAEISYVMGNSSEMREVLANIYLNAIDAMPNGGSIKVSSSAGKNGVLLTVRDTGVGMSPEIKRRVFDPFFTTKGSRGTGLGMSVVYGIIQRHGGSIEIESEPGKGTSFNILLRAAPSDAIIKSESRDKQISNVSGRILVIDDEDFICEIVSDTLSEAGCQIEVTSDPRAGIEIYGNREFDAVITDLGMPELSGWDVAKSIKGIDEDAVIILLTGWGGSLGEGEEGRKNVDIILSKPFQMDELLVAVIQAVNLRETNLSREN